MSILGESERLQTGSVVTAAPMMADPNFRRSVVLLCHHSEDGTFGLILNRVLPYLNSELAELLHGWSPALRFGGPVQSGTVHYLHNLPDDFPEAEPVVSGVYWGGDFDRVRELALASRLTEDNFRFYLGYTGWGPGQLEAEVAGKDWIVAPSNANDVFATEPDKLWSTVMRDLGGTHALMANFPADPRLN